MTDGEKLERLQHAIEVLEKIRALVTDVCAEEPEQETEDGEYESTDAAFHMLECDDCLREAILQVHAAKYRLKGSKNA